MSNNTLASEEEEVSSEWQPWAPFYITAPVAVISALVVAAALFFTFDFLGSFPTSARLETFLAAEDHPMGIKNVFTDVSVGTIAGSVVFWGIARVSDSPVYWFKRVAAVVTVIYSLFPLLMIENAPPRMIGTLWFMHIVVAATFVTAFSYQK